MTRCCRRRSRRSHFPRSSEIADTEMALHWIGAVNNQTQEYRLIYYRYSSQFQQISRYSSQFQQISRYVNVNDLKPTCQSQNGQCTNHQADGCRIVQKYLPENSVNLVFDFISNINIFINVKVSFSPSDCSIGASTHVHKLVGTLQPMDEDKETHGPEQHRAEIQQLSTMGTSA